MYLWIGLGIDLKSEEDIRNYCIELNKDYKVNLQSFTLPQHISLKTSFYTEKCNEIINDLKNIFSNNYRLNLQVTGISYIPGVVWLDILENSDLRNYHNEILKYLKEEYNIEKTGYDGDKFMFHSTLFQDIDNIELLENLFNVIDKSFFVGKEILADKIYFGISDSGEVGTFKVIDYIDLK